MAKKEGKPRKLDLSFEVANLAGQVGRLAHAFEKPGGFIQKCEEFAGMVSIMTTKLQRVEEIVGRVVFPERALRELTGELRAVRTLMDTNGIFKNMDRERLKADQEEDDRRRETRKTGTAGN